VTLTAFAGSANAWTGTAIVMITSRVPRRM
jgi:hypothetical protein